MPFRLLLICGLAAAYAVPTVNQASAQTFGVEANNTMMPAAGGMAGVSIAQPQDLTSAINGNPATLTQFKGTQFLFGGTWAEPTFNMTQTSQLPIVGPAFVEPFAAKSEAPGFPGPNIGVTQDLSAFGRPATVGIGFVTTSGGFVDFRQVPESNGTNTGLAVLSVPVVVGVDMTDRLSVGAGIALGVAFFDGPFVDISGMTIGYGVRGSVGADYKLTDATRLGVYYQTEQAFRFKNAELFDFTPGTVAEDVHMDLPQNIGFGVANTSLADGRLLLAADVLYKLWNRTALFGSIYDNQWVVQLGAQYSIGRYRLRGGYAWAENPIDPTPSVNVGGITVPGDLPGVRYTQGLLAITSQNRISGGLGVVDVLPGVDFDLMAGGMFRSREQLGAFTTTSILSYWVGFGITWRFGRGSCERLPVPNDWCCSCCN
jgi:long-chain fatty acid transport protein